MNMNSYIYMKVQKRNGDYQEVKFDKISHRLKYLVQGLDSSNQRIGPHLSIDHNDIAKNVCAQIVDGISTRRLDEFAAELCAYRVADHYEYDILASRIIISNHHKNTIKYMNFSDITRMLYNNTDRQGHPSPLIADKYYQTVMDHSDRLDQAINNNHIRDYENLNYFGFKTLEKSYLLKVSDNIQERYQHMLMRVALSTYLDDIDQAIQCYELFSQGLITHATPTLFNSGTPRPQLSSCFLMGMHDSINGMYEIIRQASHISKWAGGIGMWCSNIRGHGSLIRGTNGESSGMVPLLRVINNFALHVNQGGKRKGSLTIYLTPWHVDIYDFLEIKKNHGKEERRARDLFYALFISDLFMKRLKRALTMDRVTGTHDIMWSLMCPDECHGLNDCYGHEFDELYLKYESEKRYRRQVDIIELWNKILVSQKETGGPFMLYKDNINHKSNQKNIGVIRSSNLCCEIMEYSDHEEYGTCNLASLNLKKMVQINEDTGDTYFDHNLLAKIIKQTCRNLNRIIDLNYYPVIQTQRSNFRHRPIGIGVQGLADVFILLGLPFESPQAQKLNRDIFETMYFNAVEESCQLARNRTQMLSSISDDDLLKLQYLSSTVEYYQEYFHNLELSQRKKLTKGEENIIQSFKLQYQSDLNELNQLINQYHLNPSSSEYQYMNINRQYLGAYSSFVGSPAHQGQLQYDLWNVKPSGRWNFEELKINIAQYGLRNSLLIASMPTATTAQILGNNECFEPLTSNIYSRQVISGTFLVVNKYLQKDLIKLGMWDQQMKDTILMNRGSIQNITEIPEHLRKLYKTAWEMSNKTLIDMAVDRGAWIDQSQSFNYFVDDPTDDMLTTMHTYGWEKGLKTGMYYLRRRVLVNAQQFSIDIDKYKTYLKQHRDNESEFLTTQEKDNLSSPKLFCSLDNPDCLACQG